MIGKILLCFAAFAGAVIAAPAQLEARVIPGVEWSVKNFTRICGGYPLSCTYDFLISPGGYIPDKTCAFYDMAPDPIHQSLSDAPCSADPHEIWTFNWGYNKQYDFAVMTVVNQAEQEDAWFGWNNVSNTTDFEDVGPYPVYALGTFT